MANAKMAVQRIGQLTVTCLSESQCRRTMKRVGMSLKKSALLPGRVDEQLELEFYTQEMPRPFIRTAPGRQRYSVLGAVDSHSKEIITHRTTSNINAQSMGELLATI